MGHGDYSILNVMGYSVQCEGLNASYAFTTPSPKTDIAEHATHRLSDHAMAHRNCANIFNKLGLKYISYTQSNKRHPTLLLLFLRKPV